MPAVEARDVRKDYRAVHALAGVSLDVEYGEVFALLGPNGAGKTTLIEVLEGYRRRSGGEVSVLGVDPARGDARWKARIGIVLQSSGIFDALTVEEIIAHFASFYPDPWPVGRVIELAGLEEKRRSTVGRLSGGQRRRVDVALGIVGNPDMIFLDEPTTGFDPAARRQAWEVVRGLTGLGKTILLTTHYLDEAEQLAGRVGVIVGGQIVALGAPADIGGRQAAAARISFQLSGPLEGRAPPTGEWPVVVAGGMASCVTPSPTAAIAALTAWARACGCDELPALEVRRPSLEDVYLEMIGSGQSAPAADVR